MLRYSFLPSDFHPLVLFLGEAEAMRNFAELLQSFSENEQDIPFERVKFLCAFDDTRILLTRKGDKPGMRKVHNRPKSFNWTLEGWQAEYFSEMVSNLAMPGCKSGSVLLECAVGEIQVKASKGEYTEDFLTKSEVVGSRR